MELQILVPLITYSAETLSGRILEFEESTVEDASTITTVSSLKKRISSKYNGDGEVGDDSQFYLVHSSSGKKLKDEELLKQSLTSTNSNNNDDDSSNKFRIRRYHYSCFVEHWIGIYQLTTLWRWVARVSTVIVCSLFIASLSQISFFLPHATTIPVTFQTLAIFLVASLAGWRMGTLSVLLYLLEGLMGAPFFTRQSGGYKVLYGPSSGYLYGFVVAAFIVGFLAERGNDRVYLFHYKSSLISMIVANVSIYIVGLPVLAKHIGWELAFTKGLVPFLAGDALKIIVATLLVPSIWKLSAFLSNKTFTFKAGLNLFINQ
ncbi:hypothetical protein DFA_02086 [Cavenderia fasciculata]|uniref:Biotin transporter BioY n=1 Tax=Cavenderia fasciculata TaxID=261658 RepID=F4PYN3_CACFS|nr:uncharacterized protein DFA_02086 [Cavenderia fasciculata]EGG19299.1 hypothetical protein DFA_02086 [Cavenderia fasciculata]|eukprot:XP_004357570.1 hypothetical protein DFA_02086 [Cavenderia fasciculata]